MGSSSPVKNLPDGEVVACEVAEKEAELCFEAGSIQQHQLHPNAPLQDSRCYIYKAVGRQVGGQAEINQMSGGTVWPWASYWLCVTCICNVCGVEPYVPVTS